MFFAGSIVMFFQQIRTSFSLLLARDFERLETVAATYLSEAELKTLRAKVVGVGKEADFKKIMNDLKASAIDRSKPLVP